LSGRDPVKDYEVINRELAAYDPQLAERPQIVVATKIDALDEPERLERLKQKAREDGREFFEISSVTNRGMRELVRAVARELEELGTQAQPLTRDAAGQF
jgi:GTP-binding protein